MLVVKQPIVQVYPVIWVVVIDLQANWTRGTYFKTQILLILICHPNFDAMLRMLRFEMLPHTILRFEKLFADAAILLLMIFNDMPS